MTITSNMWWKCSDSYYGNTPTDKPDGFADLEFLMDQVLITVADTTIKEEA
jgi:hypothetical protein